MKVKAIWEFDVDVSDISPEHVDIEGLAKDLTQRELADLLLKSQISADDFAYAIEEKKYG